MKKHLAWILVLCMVFSLLPISALAADPAASYVVFHDEDGNVIDSVASPAKAIDYAPAVSGDKMLGWTQTQGSADVDFAVGADVTAAADVALYPVVDDGVYVIHFYENDGGDETPEGTGGASYTSAQYVEKGGKAVKPDDPSRPGFEFTGWFADADCKVPFDFSAPVADNAAVYAGWKKVDVPFAVVVWMQKVTDDKNATDAQKTYDFGTSYVIDGAAWIKEFSFDQVNSMLRKVNLSKLNIEGFHFNADKTDDKVTTNRYGTAVLNVYYDRDLMTMKFGNKVTMTGLYGAKVTESGKGYQWPEGLWEYRNDQGGYTGMSYLGEFIFPTGNPSGNTMNFSPIDVRNATKIAITFELQQLDNSYKPDASDVVGLVYDDWGGYRTFYFSEKYNGYAVSAYSKAADGELVPVEVDDSVELWSLRSDKMFIYYNLKSYELNYFLNGGSMEGSEKETVKFTTPLAGFDRAASRKGFTFAGWYADPDLTTKFDFAGSTMPAANLALYAKWEPIVYHVKAIVGDDVVIPDGQSVDFHVNYGKPVEGTSFEAAARPGYELDGWYLSDAEGNPADPYQFGVALNEGTKGLVTENGEQVLYITPKWAENPDAFTVSYDVNGGAGEIADGNFYLKDANAIITEEVPTAPAGYQFAGWAKTPDAAKAEFTARQLTDEIQGDLTLYAVYCPIQVGYTIEYYYDGVKDDSATVIGTADFGSTVQYPDKAKDGFVFESADPEKLVMDLDPAKNLQKVYYVTDTWNDEEDDPNKPDGIPDKYQVLVNYKADANGKVTGREVEIITLVDAEGNYVQSGDVTTSGSEAQGDPGYMLENWTDPENNTSADGVFAFSGVAGGSVIDVVAHFTTDNWNDEEDDPNKPDGIPDKYQVLVKYVADENGEVTGREVEIITLVDAEGNYVKSGDITTAGSEAQANEDYKFVNWTDPAERPSSDGVFAIPGVAGGSTVVITAHFAKQAEQKLVKVWDDKDDIDQIRPDSVKVDLKQGDKVVKADVELTAEDDWTYVWYGDGEWTVEEKDVAEGYTAEVTKGEDGSYVLTNTHVVIPELEKEDHFGYIIGRQVGDKVLIQPEANVTRAEVVTVFFRLLTEESRDKFWSSTNDFSDVAATSWFNNAVSTMTRAGVINGYPDGTFHPNAPITRAELATIAVRFFELQKSDKNVFTDTEGHWAVQFINAAAENNLITGYPDGTFQPNKNIIRAEFITVVNRMIERKPDKQHLLPKDQMVNWDDNPEGTWYYEQIQEATNSHEYEWITVMDAQGEGVVIENWTKPLPMRDWVQLEKEWSDAHSGGNPGEVIEP